MDRLFLLCMVLIMALPGQVQAAFSGSVKLYNNTSYSDKDESYKNESILTRLILAYRNDQGFYINTRFFTRYHFEENEFSKIKNYNYVGFSKKLTERLALDSGFINCLKYGCEIAGGKESFDIESVYVGALLDDSTSLYVYYRDDFFSTLPARFFVEFEHYSKKENYTYGLGSWYTHPLKDGQNRDASSKPSQVIWASISKELAGINYEAQLRAQMLKEGKFDLNSNTKPSFVLMMSKPFKL